MADSGRSAALSGGAGGLRGDAALCRRCGDRLRVDEGAPEDGLAEPALPGVPICRACVEAGATRSSKKIYDLPPSSVHWRRFGVAYACAIPAGLVVGASAYLYALERLLWPAPVVFGLLAVWLGFFTVGGLITARGDRLVQHAGVEAWRDVLLQRWALEGTALEARLALVSLRPYRFSPRQPLMEFGLAYVSGDGLLFWGDDIRFAVHPEHVATAQVGSMMPLVRRESLIFELHEAGAINLRGGPIFVQLHGRSSEEDRRLAELAAQALRPAEAP